MFFHSDSRPGLKSKVSNKCFGREITQKRLCRLVLSQVEAAILWLRCLRDKTNLNLLMRLHQDLKITRLARKITNTATTTFSKSIPT